MIKKLFSKKGSASQERANTNVLNEAARLTLNKAFLDQYEHENDPQSVFDLCKSFADQGSDEALYLLGVLYEKGDGQKTYSKQAADSYWLAAKAGKPEAQYNLGLMCAQGLINEPDMLSAIHWFELASTAGIKEATYNLATCYDQGLGCLADKKKAYSLFQIAGEQGFVRAWHNVAVMLYLGEGVGKDLVAAYARLLLAAKAGLQDSIDMEPSLSAELNAEQILEGKAQLDALMTQFASLLPTKQSAAKPSAQFYTP